MDSKPVVHYFEIWGRGEPIRMMLWAAKVPYENKFVPLPKEEGWKDVRDDYEFKAVPALDIDGKRLTQTSSIMRYIARKYGMAPEDPYQEYLVDSVCEVMQDIFMGMMPLFRAAPEEKMAATKKFTEETLEVKIGYIENRLKKNSNQDYLVGDKITVADVMYLNAYYSMWLDENNKNEERNALYKAAFDKHPVFVKYIEGMRQKFDEYWTTQRIKSKM